MKILLKISFLGTAYCGYQVQGDKPTVQQALNNVTERVFGFKCDIVGCSRTDTGVHANEFYLTVSKHGEEGIEFTIPLEKIPIAMNSLLPPDISVVSAEVVDNLFHARYDVELKEYEYRIWNGANKNPFTADRELQHQYPISDEMLDNMNRAAFFFVGTHDFTAFMAQGSKVTSTERTVFYADVRREGERIIFRVAADGFLYNMVRIMAGTLLDVSRGRFSPDEVGLIIKARDRSLAGATAPACGLYLNKVSYKK